MKKTAMLRAAAGAAGGFDVGTPLHNWDFSDSTTLFTDTGLTTPISADGIIKGAADLGSGNKKMTEATNGPTWKTAVQNALAVARFDGTNDKMLASTTARAQPVTWVVAAKFNETAEGHYMIGEGTSAHLIGAGNTKFTYGVVVASSMNKDTDWHVFTYVSSGASSKFYVDDVDKSTTVVDTDTFGDIGIGDGANSGFLGVDIGQVLVYGSALSDGNRLAYTAALREKWDTP
jgi:hypothetical protein